MYNSDDTFNKIIGRDPEKSCPNFAVHKAVEDWAVDYPSENESMINLQIAVKAQYGDNAHVYHCNEGNKVGIYIQIGTGETGHLWSKITERS